MNQNLKEKIIQIINSNVTETQKMQLIEQLLSGDALLNFINSFKQIGLNDKLESIKQFFSLNDEEIRYIYESGFFEKKLIFPAEVNPKIIQELISLNKITVNSDGKFIPGENSNCYYKDGKPTIDFLDPENKERLKLIRCLYLSIEKMIKQSIGYNEQSGESLENFINNLSPDQLLEITKKCVELRNRAKIIARIFNTTYERDVLEKRNIEKYQNPTGPSFEEIINNYVIKNSANPKYLGMSNEEKERLIRMDALKFALSASFRTDPLTNVLVGLINPSKTYYVTDEEKNADAGLSDSSEFDAENSKANNALSNAGQRLGNVVIGMYNPENVEELSSVSKK